MGHHPKQRTEIRSAFFSVSELVLFATALLVIHYLMVFDWLMVNWFPGLSVFVFSKGIPSKSWAYILALVIIVYPIVKVNFSFFAKSRLPDLISLYETYLKEGEVDLLASFIAKYHIDDIERFKRGESKVPEKSSKDIVLRRRTEADVAYKKLVSPKRILFAAWVYSNILSNEAFVRSAANKYPELFAKAFNGMRTKGAADQDFAKLYTGELFIHKNKSLIEELKIVNDSNSSLLDIQEQYDIPILVGLLAHTEAAEANYVWYSIGNEAVKSLKHDSNQREFLLQEHDYDLEPEMWGQKIYIAIVYFNYMVRETIYRDNGYHMWLFYYDRFVALLVEMLPDENTYEPRSEYPSFAHKMIYELFSNMTDWLALARDQDNDHRVIDTIRCLGKCVHLLCQANDDKILPRFRRRMLDMVLNAYFKFSDYPDNPASKTATEWFEKMFTFPEGTDFGIREVTDEYLVALQDAWEHFDKVPFQYHGTGEAIVRFRDNVLTPLGLEL
ncbi:hypothetical protein ACFQT0_28560 [Hymenobacter humi]|uniref:Uncharacterized protein n=1 Tax=Hymenobacter humi TaxID=1411620 RepID=A0ABW2UDM6_9BACT